MKWIKYILIFVVGVAFLPFAILLGAGYITFRVAKYLWGEKEKYKNPKDCLKDVKNIGALIIVLVGIITVPLGLFKYSKFCLETAAKGQVEQEVKKDEKEAETEKRAYENSRKKILTPSKRILGEIDSGINVDDTCKLSKDDIEKYSITPEEVSKFEEDRKVAIQNYKDGKVVEGLERKAKEYMSKNTTSTMGKHFFSRNKSGYGFNEDKTVITIYGHYEGRTLQLVNIKNYYSVKFDAKTGEVIEADLGKEMVDSTKHPKKKK